LGGVLKALVVGSAACLPHDLAAARALFEPDLVVAVNHAARDWEGPLDHWATMHPELMPRWLKDRRAKGLPDPGAFWTATRRLLAPADHLQQYRRLHNRGGSSGMLAAFVALEVGAERSVLVGIPMDRSQGHYDNPAPWGEAGSYRRAWYQERENLRTVRSMSGLTAELLGKPTKEWLDGA
jgi:hypothetical protein